MYINCTTYMYIYGVAAPPHQSRRLFVIIAVGVSEHYGLYMSCNMYMYIATLRSLSLSCHSVVMKPIDPLDFTLQCAISLSQRYVTPIFNEKCSQRTMH